MSNTTNDQQGEYKREPLLSDAAIDAHTATAGTGFFRHELIRKHNIGGPAASFTEGASFARSRYEEMITSGELMVVRTARLVRAGNLFPDYMYVKCDNCQTEYVSGEGGDRMPEVGQFCLCGAKIVA